MTPWIIGNGRAKRMIRKSPLSVIRKWLRQFYGRLAIFALSAGKPSMPIKWGGGRSTNSFMGGGIFLIWGEENVPKNESSRKILDPSKRASGLLCRGFFYRNNSAMTFPPSSLFHPMASSTFSEERTLRKTW